jgi:septal ring factor EnvC (AmiA/AmiB activator)
MNVGRYRNGPWIHHVRTTSFQFYVVAGFVIFLLISSHAFGQKNKSQLQKEKQQNLEKIRETEKILEETGQQKKNSIGELNALNQRIGQQEELISSTKGEIHFLDTDIDENTQFVQALQQDLAKLKDEYARMLFSAQKASGKTDKLTFLFSASSFEQMLMRLKYMEQYGQARQDQAEAILRTEDLLKVQIHQTELIKDEKNTLLGEEVTQNDQLASLKQKQKTVVRSLEKEESRLKKDLDETRKSVAQLDKLINDIIKEEMERAAREAREAKAKSNASASVVTPEAVLSASFEENRSKFPWPAPGFISQKFGRQNHPVLKGIILQNDGINIQTQQGERVKSIFDGEVRAVAVFPTIGSSVIISHGEYFTVYSGLREVFVKKGQKVTTNQEIGQVSVNSDGISELRFQIRKNTVALNPQAWLKE